MTNVLLIDRINAQLLVLLLGAIHADTTFLLMNNHRHLCRFDLPPTAPPPPQARFTTRTRRSPTHSPHVQPPPLPSHGLPRHLRHSNHHLWHHLHTPAPSPLPKPKNFDDFVSNFNSRPFINNFNIKPYCNLHTDLSSHLFIFIFHSPPPLCHFPFRHLCPPPTLSLRNPHQSLYPTLHPNQNPQTSPFPFSQPPLRPSTRNQPVQHRQIGLPKDPIAPRLLRDGPSNGYVTLPIAPAWNTRLSWFT